MLYTGKLNWFLPTPALPALAWMSTVLETALGVALLLGVFPRLVAAMSGILLLLFALAMTLALGIKAPLDASVFTALAGAFLLSVVPDDRPAAPRGGNSTRVSSPNVDVSAPFSTLDWITRKESIRSTVDRHSASTGAQPPPPHRVR
jgi:hypothetical protein